MPKEWWEDDGGYADDAFSYPGDKLVHEKPQNRRITYDLMVPYDYYHRTWTEDEMLVLRPIAETLAMLHGNAFFTHKLANGRDWYEQYLPEAYALYISNGGATGWAGEVSWNKDARHETAAIKEAYDNWQVLKKLSMQ